MEQKPFTLLLWILLPFFILLLPLTALGENPDVNSRIHDQKNSLRKIQQSISEKKEAIQSIEKKERSLLSQLQTMDQKLSFKEEQLKSYDTTLKTVQEEKKEFDGEIEILRAGLSRFQEYLSSKVVRLYKYGGYSYVKALFSAGSYSDFLERYRYVRVMAEKDKEAIESYQTVYNDLHTKQQELAAREEKIVSLKTAFEEKNREVLAKRKERAALLNSMRKEKTYQETLLEELEQSSRVLQAAVNDLIRKRESLVGDFKKFKGRLPWPVEGDVITQFGKQKHEKFNTYVFSKGIDIEARKGKDVRAIHDGSVLFADWFKGYGKMLILDHGRGFYSLYAHLSEIVVPDKSTVTKGQPVGTVGETGSLQGPLLYFEIRHHGKPEDPLVWLTRR